jgi:plasmid stabilization system protein ParE
VIRLEFSPESELDLMEIAAFIARDNPARARSFVRTLFVSSEEEGMKMIETVEKVRTRRGYVRVPV